MSKNEFITTVGTLAMAEKANRSRWVLPSVCIAQAALESGWNLKAKTLFGIKGNGNNLRTTEYINGKYVMVTAAFKSFPSVAAAVHGYYDLICQSPRYAGAVNNPDFRSAARAIKNGGYATDPSYADKIIRIIIDNHLTSFDYAYLEKTKTPDNVTFHNGRDYIVTPDIGLNVRKNHFKNAKKVKAYPKGTIFTCLESWLTSDGSVWVRTPSGWVCGYDGTANCYYAKEKK